MNSQTVPIEWLPLLLLAAAAVVMVFLLRRSMRGMNQQDWILLRQARRRGIDVRQPQAVDFVVFAATEETAAELAEKMRGDSFETSIKEAQIQYARNRNKPSAAQGGWLVSGRRTVLLVPETLTGIRETLTEMSLERKAVYLGWQLADAAPSQGSSTQTT